MAISGKIQVSNDFSWVFGRGLSNCLGPVCNFDKSEPGGPAPIRVIREGDPRLPRW